MKKFYDIHMHALDLSHPNLSAFLFKEDLISSVINWKIRLATLIVPLGAFLPKRFIVRQIKSILDENTFIKNTLSFYEIPIEYQFLLVDYFLKYPEKQGDIIVGTNNEFSINGELFDKIVLCPLAIDFGYKNMNEQGVFYNKAPFKPIAKQLGDLFYAIRTYYRFNLGIDDNPLKLKLIDHNKTLDESKQEKLFEIYPFMGLNTQNYTLDKLKGEEDKPGLLDKYFSNFRFNESPQQRRDRLFSKLGTFDGKMYEKDETTYKDIFAGIKVYPQLGFDPYPGKKEEREKVEFLYQYCIDKRIPIMTHCSDGGFKVGDFNDITNPGKKWKEVLKNFPELTLCFAHFGRQGNGAKDWQNSIIELTKYKNVFTDISCNDATPAYYLELNNTINRETTNLKSKIIFGSDFSINMFASKVKSYNHYLKVFLDSNQLENKQDLCLYNPEVFLFGP